MIGWLFLIGHGRMRDSDQAGCLFNQRAVFMAAQVYEKDHGLSVGDPLDRKAVLRIAGIERFECPSGGEYTWREALPRLRDGEVPVSCSHEDHQPELPVDW